MKKFEKEGTFDVEIIEAYIAEPKFNKESGAIDVAITCRGENGEEDTWTGEISDKYGVGNAAGKMQWELTVSSLEKIGWKHGTNINDETLAELVGQTIPVSVVGEVSKKNGKTYYNIKYLGESSFRPKRMNPADQKARLAALFGSGPATGAPAPAQQARLAAPAQAKASVNPFA